MSDGSPPSRRPRLDSPSKQPTSQGATSAKSTEEEINFYTPHTPLFHRDDNEVLSEQKFVNTPQGYNPPSTPQQYAMHSPGPNPSTPQNDPNAWVNSIFPLTSGKVNIPSGDAPRYAKPQTPGPRTPTFARQNEEEAVFHKAANKPSSTSKESKENKKPPVPSNMLQPKLKDPKKYTNDKSKHYGKHKLEVEQSKKLTTVLCVSRGADPNVDFSYIDPSTDNDFITEFAPIPTDPNLNFSVDTELPGSRDTVLSLEQAPDSLKKWIKGGKLPIRYKEPYSTTKVVSHNIPINLIEKLQQYSFKSTFLLESYSRARINTATNMDPQPSFIVEVEAPNVALWEVYQPIIIASIPGMKETSIINSVTFVSGKYATYSRMQIVEESLNPIDGIDYTLALYDKNSRSVVAFLNSTRSSQTFTSLTENGNSIEIVSGYQCPDGKLNLVVLGLQRQDTTLQIQINPGLDLMKEVVPKNAINFSTNGVAVIQWRPRDSLFKSASSNFFHAIIKVSQLKKSWNTLSISLFYPGMFQPPKREKNGDLSIPPSSEIPISKNSIPSDHSQVTPTQPPVKAK